MLNAADLKFLEVITNLLKGCNCLFEDYLKFVKMLVLLLLIK